MSEVIKIGGIDYRVIEVKALIDQDDQDTQLLGEIDYNNCEIRLEQLLNTQIQFQTRWHEVIHAILVQAGFRDHDERMVDALAYGLVQVMRDNPQLVYHKSESGVNDA